MNFYVLYLSQGENDSKWAILFMLVQIQWRALMQMDPLTGAAAGFESARRIIFAFISAFISA